MIEYGQEEPLRMTTVTGSRREGGSACRLPTCNGPGARDEPQVGRKRPEVVTSIEERARVREARMASRKEAMRRAGLPGDGPPGGAR